MFVTLTPNRSQANDYRGASEDITSVAGLEALQHLVNRIGLGVVVIIRFFSAARRIPAYHLLVGRNIFGTTTFSYVGTFMVLNTFYELRGDHGRQCGCIAGTMMDEPDDYAVSWITTYPRLRPELVEG